MNRRLFPLVLALSLGCGGAAKPAAGEGGGGGPGVLAKKLSVSWGIQPAGPMTDLFLALTDETGKVVSHPLGSWQGACAVTAAAPEMGALTAVACRTGGTGTELHAVTHGGDEIVVLQLRTDEGVTPDPMAREEVKRIKVPLGAAIVADPIAATEGAP